MRAVIFDMDGVLIDSEPLHFAVDKALLKRLNISVPENYLDKFVGTTNPAMWGSILSEFGIEADIDEILAEQIGLKIDGLREGRYRPISGIPDLLFDLLNRNILMAVASSSPPEFIEEVLYQLSIIDYFETWVSGEGVPQSKPQPDIFLKAAELLEVRPEACLVIEDSENGVMAARNAGMKCIGFQNENSGRQDLSRANLVIDDFRKLKFSIIASCFAGACRHP